MLNAYHLSATDPPARLAGKGHGQRRPATVAMPQGNDFLRAGGRFSQHHCRFVGLGAAVEDVGRLQSARADVRQLFGQKHVVLVGVEGGGVN